MKTVEELLEEVRRKRSIICPHCGYIHDPARDWEILEGLISYHGEEEPQAFTCHQCNVVFFVKEWVERTFESKKTMKEFDL